MEQHNNVDVAEVVSDVSVQMRPVLVFECPVCHAQNQYMPDMPKTDLAMKVTCDDCGTSFWIAATI